MRSLYEGLEAAAAAATFAACGAISVAVARHAQRSPAVNLRPFRRLFALFFLAVGCAQAADIMALFWPGSAGPLALRLAVAAFVVTSTVVLVPAVPRFAALRTPDELASEAARRSAAEVHLDGVKNFSRDVIDKALIGVAVFDPAGAVVDWNRAAAALTGWDRDEVVGRSVTELALFASHGQMNDAAAVLGTQDSMREALIRARDGRLVPVEFGVVFVHGEGKNQLAVVFVRDMTAAKTRERQLRHRVRDLEHALTLRAELDRRLDECRRALPPSGASALRAADALQAAAADARKVVSGSL